MTVQARRGLERVALGPRAGHAPGRAPLRGAGGRGGGPRQVGGAGVGTGAGYEVGSDEVASSGQSHGALHGRGPRAPSCSQARGEPRRSTGCPANQAAFFPWSKREPELWFVSLPRSGSQPSMLGLCGASAGRAPRRRGSTEVHTQHLAGAASSPGFPACGDPRGRGRDPRMEHSQAPRLCRVSRRCVWSRALAETRLARKNRPDSLPAWAVGLRVLLPASRSGD